MSPQAGRPSDQLPRSQGSAVSWDQLLAAVGLGGLLVLLWRRGLA